MASFITVNSLKLFEKVAKQEKKLKLPQNLTENPQNISTPIGDNMSEHMDDQHVGNKQIDFF